MNELNNFKKSLAFVLKWEGVYSFDPSDPGGETKWGISKRYHPDLDIKNLTPEQACDIYAKEYWDTTGCDNIPFPLCTVVFDTAVNCGVSRASNWLRNAPDASSYIQTRQNFYYDRVNKNPVMSKYIRGWMNRLNDLKKFVEINNPVQ